LARWLAIDDMRTIAPPGAIASIAFCANSMWLRRWTKMPGTGFCVNIRSHMLFAQKAMEAMAPGGAIVLMSSMASQRANGRNPAYESSKAAQIALGRAIARAGEDKAFAAM